MASNVRGSIGTGMVSHQGLTGFAVNTGTAVAQTAEFKFVDISDRPLKSTIVRAGKEVPVVNFNRNAVDQFVSSTVTVAAQSPRVVSQSVPPGTKLAVGGSVDLVLAPRNRIPIGVFAGGHAGIATLANVDAVVTNLLSDAVTAAVLDHPTADQVPEAIRTAITTELAGKGVTIDAADSSRNFAAAFRTLQGAAAFK